VVVKFTININLFIIFLSFDKNIINFKRKACSSVDRASDSDSESQGFDSLHAYRFFFLMLIFYDENCIFCKNLLKLELRK
jgi:hypothetical protein